MKRIITVCFLVLLGASGWAPAAAQDVQAELDKGLTFARAGDYAAARIIWSSLARSGNTEAQFRLGWLYESGAAGKRNLAEAAYWYAVAADLGHASALYNLAVMLTEGRGVARNDAKAAKYFRRAAVQGHAKAQYNLGILYRIGRGVPQDVARARFWLDRAKANGIVIPKIAAKV